ncbi:D-alanine--D-alanine ligase [Actinacidiphila glaucinigra]|uniref:D-alanine--D-alanine ligase family protein n=1 Tax=Actinacidiphila glaucinigra TaxID=235986 RepID=UPI002DD94DC8|nr:D-alanine--D-alanine ligase [Actinacidiphila glaucinigra]WSD65093.1 D-alanine--D-alanine ligase [Actinacidiphila glaucinigra]
MTTHITHLDRATVTRDAETLRTWLEDNRGFKVALVYGGLSAEDRLYIEQSPTDQLSVTALAETLAGIGVPFSILNPCDETFIQEITEYDVALSNLHGPYGEDGRLQGLLDYLRIPFCGSGVAASATAADKVLCKQAMAGLGVPTPPWRVWSHGKEPGWAGRPLMVKPPLGGSSVGMSLVSQAAELGPALQRAWETDPSPVLVEDYIAGHPVTIGLLELPSGVLAFPPLVTLVDDAVFYDAASKLDAAAAKAVSVEPANFPRPVLDCLIGHARTLWDGLGCRGAARVDFIVAPDGDLYALEVNTTPGMSRDSNFVVGGRLRGLTRDDLVRAFLHEALTRPAYDVPLPTPVFGTPTALPEHAT